MYKTYVQHVCNMYVEYVQGIIFTFLLFLLNCMVRMLKIKWRQKHNHTHTHKELKIYSGPVTPRAYAHSLKALH